MVSFELLLNGTKYYRIKSYGNWFEADDNDEAMLVYSWF
jgi:hypothetical protein